MREWLVAGGVVTSDDRILLVRNRRRTGAYDWSTPGGVVDATDASLLAGLTREVAEETGLSVTRWDGPLYSVVAEAPDLGWRMRCEVHRAVSFEGVLALADPDGIVVDAAFVPASRAAVLLAGCAAWVREPILEWIDGRWGAGAPRHFRYDVRGSRPDALDVRRAAGAR